MVFLRKGVKREGGNENHLVSPRFEGMQKEMEKRGFSRGLSLFKTDLKEGNLKKLLVFMWIFALILPLMFLGCSDGDDGATGAQGEQGEPGTPGGPGAGTAATPESCAVCHESDLSGIDVETVHAEKGVATVGTVAVDNAASLVFTFDIAVDGVPNDSFTLRRAYVNYDNAALQTDPPTLITTFVRETLYSTSGTGTDVGLTLPDPVGGTYTYTVPTAYQIDNATYLFQLESATSTERPIAVATWGTRQLRDLVTSGGSGLANAVGCASCHGPFPAWSEKFSHYAVGGADCQICHSQAGPNSDNVPSRNMMFISKDAAGAFVEAGPFYGTNLVEYIHGIHNSHNMPDGVYYRTDEPDATATIEDRYSIGYPSDMRSCDVCHATPAQLDAAATAPVSYYLCMSCHNNWDGFVDHHSGEPIMTGPLGAIHRGLDPTTVNCMLVNGCHGGLPAADEAADFHVDLVASDRHYDSFFGGQDISFVNPNGVGFAITGVTVAGDNVTFTWTAERLSAAVDPCNTDLAAGPVFTDLGAYLAYPKGDDWVNEFVGSSPGQPASAKNLFTSLATTCAANVATTTGLEIDPDATYSTTALLAIGGKPIDQDTFLIGTTATDNAFFIRFPSPTYAFTKADGSPAAARRDAVNTDRCLRCHRGTLYQHGGDRVDNEQLCVICHNPSSADKNNRLERYQIVNADNTVNTDATYDGKTSETYDLRTMLHGIHGVEHRVEHGGNPWVIYRSRGIYAFVPQLYEEIDGDVFAVDYPKPTGWPDDGMTIYGSLNGSTIAHNWVVVHYPKPANECEACHDPGKYGIPDQAEAVALTVEPGASYPDQSDDIVRGPAAAACTACHNDAPVQVHATDFGYLTNVTKEEMLEKAQ